LPAGGDLVTSAGRAPHPAGCRRAPWHAWCRWLPAR